MSMFLEPVYDLSVTYFSQTAYWLKKLEDAQIVSFTYPFADILFFYSISLFSGTRLTPVFLLASFFESH
jgi:hypothetical protein